MPWMPRARDIKVGVQKAKAPVTKAMAVTPRVDHTKLRLENINQHMIITTQKWPSHDLYARISLFTHFLSRYLTSSR